MIVLSTIEALAFVVEIFHTHRISTLLRCLPVILPAPMERQIQPVAEPATVGATAFAEIQELL